MIRRAFFIALAVALTAISTQAQVRDSLALTLTDAVTRALQTGDEARIAKAFTDATRAQVTTALSAGLPQIRLTGSRTRQIESARATAVNNILSQPLTNNVTATISQPNFQGGRVLAGMRAAGALKNAAQLSESETR